MSNIKNGYDIDVAIGKIPKHKSVNKFGRAPSGVQTTATDIWDRADATPTQQIWVAPTVARTHQIVSSSVNDASAGTGVRTIKIYGLKDWDTPEVSEIITLNGTTDVPTANKYVIIHRMKMMTYGSGGTNAGNLIATADTDATVTAQINTGQGQTQMAIYGIPSGVSCVMKQYYISVNKNATSLSILTNLLINDTITSGLNGFKVKHSQGVVTEGNSYVCHKFDPPFIIKGPAIIKMQGNSSTADTDGSAGFDLILIND